MELRRMLVALFFTCATAGAAAAEEQGRYESGVARLGELDPNQPAAMKRALQDVAPDMERYTMEFAFGDVYSRPGLDLRTRQMLTVAMLAAMGNARPQLKAHLGLSLNVGVTLEELREILIQTSVYAGFPNALNGLYALKEVMQERNLGRPGQ